MLLTAHHVSRPHPETAFLSRYAALLDIMLRIGDVAIVVAAACLCHWARLGTWTMANPYPVAVLLTVLLALLVFPMCGVYRSWRGESLGSELLRLGGAWLCVITLLTVLNWALKYSADISRLWVASWFAAATVLLSLHRWVARRLLGALRALGVDTRSVVLVGGTAAGARILEATRKNPWMGLNVEGYVATPYDQESNSELPCLGDFDAFLANLRNKAPDQIWVALPLRAENLIQRLLEATAEIATTVRLVPDLFGYELINHSSGSIGGVPVITLRGSRIVGHARVIKAVEDRILATLILLLASPLMLLLAIGVKLSSPGPVFYRQRRVGLDGREFEMLKFRSMPIDVEKSAVRWGNAKTKPMTSFGRFIRASSLDELPQLINVLKGELSIVGPRPERPMFVREFRASIPGYMHKHLVKGGITGWAQINGWRGDTDLGRRIECDLHYINHWSPWLDLKIIALTPVVLLKRTNAY